MVMGVDGGPSKDGGSMIGWDGDSASVKFKPLGDHVPKDAAVPFQKVELRKWMGDCLVYNDPRLEGLTGIASVDWSRVSGTPPVLAENVVVLVRQSPKWNSDQDVDDFDYRFGVLLDAGASHRGVSATFVAGREDFQGTTYPSPVSAIGGEGVVGQKAVDGRSLIIRVDQGDQETSYWEVEASPNGRLKQTDPITYSLSVKSMDESMLDYLRSRNQQMASL